MGACTGALVPDCRWMTNPDSLSLFQSSATFPRPTTARDPGNRASGYVRMPQMDAIAFVEGHLCTTPHKLHRSRARTAMPGGREDAHRMHTAAPNKVVPPAHMAGGSPPNGESAPSSSTTGVCRHLDSIGSHLLHASPHLPPHSARATCAKHPGRR